MSSNSRKEGGRENLITWSPSSTVWGDLLGKGARKPHIELLDGHVCQRLEVEEKDGVSKVTSAVAKDLAKPKSKSRPLTHTTEKQSSSFARFNREET